ncbi:hypothetical protein [Algoriphagus aquimarinus]|uniref:Uncharacterized protein n=1 Tax=Algoriphagus aquimarinus TaxID=237018 RepID=A0A5C7AY33_9BACT|nr:hypothetical protein [Algoriphagus aquimarinus]TXE13730.1 hypothetical protein ESV85_07125 [Algoriphagus aquimarinus]
MLNWLFGKKPSGQSKTGIYKVDNRALVELEESPGNGSVNSIIEYLGFDTSQVHTVFTFDSPLIEIIGFKVFTEKPVFAVAKNKARRVDLGSLNKEIKGIDWRYEYSSHTVEDTLTEGIERESFSIDFLSSVLLLKHEGDDLYQAPKIGLYLKFENGLLKSFTSSDWSNSASKWLKDFNSDMFEDMLSEAMQYHRNEIEAMEEVNLQCESLRGIPQAIQNEFIYLHEKVNGNINFFNLLAAHYNLLDGERIKIDDFKTVNKGRFVAIEENIVKVDQFAFRFDTDGFLLDAKTN